MIANISKRSNNNNNLCPLVYFAVIFLLSAASLSYEINITRLFSVTQFYHFAFLIVSLALLGFGASGAFLALFSHFGSKNIDTALYCNTFFAALGFLVSYLITNFIPFDSYSFALGWKQLAIFVFHLIVITIPFFFSGLSVALLIRYYSRQVNLIYAVNLSGSAFGCLLVIILPGIISSVGIVVFCTLLALSASFLLIIRLNNLHLFISNSYIVLIGLFSVCFSLLCLSDIYLRVFRDNSFDFMKLNISPYKGISYALQYPGAEIVYQKWNAFSRVDLVHSRGIRSLPGYSYMSHSLPPEQSGLFIDGDDLSTVILGDEVADVTKFMPSSIAYALRPDAKVLILEPRGGSEIVIAHSEGAESIDTSEPNPLVVEAAQNIYDQVFIDNHLESGRSYLRKSHEFYDVIILSLNSTFHPIRSGAYGLGEDYRYTVEAFEDAVQRLNTNGVFIVTRWLQTPPSEFLRAFGIAVEALEDLGRNPAQAIAAFRSYNTGTLVVKRGDFTLDEISTIRDFTSRRAYDVVYYPGIQEKEVNKYNILPEPYYYQSFTSLLFSGSRQDWYRDYPYDVKPPTDDKPFFNQYFKWSQLPQMISEFGKVWEPFGGAGFIILLFLFILTIIFSVGFILVPTIISIHNRTFERGQLLKLGYFAAIGLGFLFIEMPLIQCFILFLDNPSYSLVTVLFALLFFSGIGSKYSSLYSLNKVFGLLILLNLMNIILLKPAINLALGLPLILRILITVGLIAPTGFFMGMPFPVGMRSIVNSRNELLSWAWGVNGAFSVVAGVAAALFSINFGFRFVLIVGAILYFGAWMLIRVSDTQSQSPHP